MKNSLTMLLVAQGVPMLLMGDECGRTQLGNNNAYCHDSPLTWFDWNLFSENAELFRFCRLMIRFRKEQPILRSPSHDGPHAPTTVWHGTRAYQADWSGTSRVLAFQRSQTVASKFESIYVAMNMHWENLDFELPILAGQMPWHVVANTSMPAPEDIWEPGNEPTLADQTHFKVAGRSIVVLIAK